MRAPLGRYIASQERLEYDAREVLPYAFDTCTHALGHLRQPVYACRTCVPSAPQSPPPFGETRTAGAAALCYSCSISCHGDHELVEIFEKRGVRCDCGTTRLPGLACELRKERDGLSVDGKVPSAEEEAEKKKDEGNRYGQNYWGRFCKCEVQYQPEKEQGTMFQCFLGDACGEDWFHDVCVVGLGPPVYAKDGEEAPADKMEEAADKVTTDKEEVLQLRTEVITEPALPSEASVAETSNPPAVKQEQKTNGTATAAAAATDAAEQTQPVPAAAAAPAGDADAAADEDDEEDEDPPPPGFPAEEFEHFICWACVDKNPWLKRYAGTPGFLPGVPNAAAAAAAPQPTPTTTTAPTPPPPAPAVTLTAPPPEPSTPPPPSEPAAESRKRKAASPLVEENGDSKRLKTPSPAPTSDADANAALACKLPSLPPAIPSTPILTCTISSAPMSLFLQASFREHLCRCAACYPQLARHRCLLEPEETYSPPKDDDAASDAGSVMDRGEAALMSGDRVRAIEGVMAYNAMKEKVKAFLKPFAERGEEVGEKDVRKWFEGLKE